MTLISPYWPTINLNVNGLNCPTKVYRVTEWIKKQDSTTCCLPETHFDFKDTLRVKVKEWKKIFDVNGNQKRAGVAILTSDKIDFKSKTVLRDKEGHYKMIKRSMYQEDITIINIQVCNIGAPKYIKHTPTDTREK